MLKFSLKKGHLNYGTCKMNCGGGGKQESGENQGNTAVVKP